MQGERSAPKETVTKHDLLPLRAVMVFLLSGLGSGLGDASAALDKFKAIAACLVPPERDDVPGRFTVTHTCMDHEKHLARVADQQFSFRTQGLSSFFGGTIWHEQVSGTILLVECIVQPIPY